ncbi:FAD-dependent monooxygenase [Roseivivax sp. GX 12232]|uniref:FAD-dependent monooxygenase n=1 Tax=Roseivivax sp. GX 12232 TaxID=2900547 RepID=UPI001E46F79A|nr:FAD-dependent monooxygenase [Roseivivax sp. GX 12232]MCE0504237.1 FAD-dependent monooxygenase [Roseivivax sp. GX 12232]
MDLTARRIAVVGGGIGGLAAALAFRQAGAEVTVLEQAEALREVGAGLQLSPNGLAVLRALGVAVNPGGAPRARAVSLRDYREGREVLRLDLGRLGPGMDYRLVHRADLIDALARAAREAGVKMRLLQKVSDITPGSPARLRMANGDGISADLVIGADGLHSAVRPALNGPAAPRFTGQVAWRAVVPNVTGHPTEARVHMGPGRHLVSYPLRDGEAVNLVAVEERRDWVAESWSHHDDPENLQRAFAGFGGASARLLAEVETPGLWGLFRHPVAARWHAEGVALLGDAAHPTLPFLAQGANLALEDAWELCDACIRAETLGAGLAAYQSRRRDRATRVIKAASGNAWKFHLALPGLRQAAHLALSLGGRYAPDLMLKQFDWLYRYDPTAPR